VTLSEAEHASLVRIRELVLPYVVDDSSGHDIGHAERCAELGIRLAVAEGANVFVVGGSALVHDMFRPRELETGESHVGPRALADVERLLQQAGVGESDLEAMAYCVRVHEDYPFWGGRPPASLEAAVFQDVDRLDALGAIGVARTFLYAGAAGLRIGALRGDSPDVSTAVGHFYEKLLRLRDAMNTESGRRLAAPRHELLLRYLEELRRESQDIA
jgi:uncharacterized protein